MEPIKLHPMSMSHIYEVFEHLLRLGMGIWLHIHTLTTTDASQDLERLAEILPDASVQTMPLYFDWDCRMFQTASTVHCIPIWGVWAPSQAEDGLMASHSHQHHHRLSLDLGKLAEILPDVSVQTMPQHFDWGWRTFQTASHVHVIHICGVSAPSKVVDGHMASHSPWHHHSWVPKFGKVGWIPTWCKCTNHATMLQLWLSNLSNCIPCPCHTYLSCLRTFSGCGWAYGFTLTLLQPLMLPQIWRGLMKSYLM